METQQGSLTWKSFFTTYNSAREKSKENLVFINAIFSTRNSISPFKDETYLCIRRFSPYLSVNTINLRYKIQTVNVV